MYAQLTAFERAKIQADARHIADSSPLDLDVKEVLTVLTTASLVAAKLGVPLAEIAHATGTGLPPEAA